MLPAGTPVLIVGKLLALSVPLSVSAGLVPVPEHAAPRPPASGLATARESESARVDPSGGAASEAARSGRPCAGAGSEERLAGRRSDGPICLDINL